MQQILELNSGANSITEVILGDDGTEIITHHIEFADGTLSTKTCTCTCQGKGSDYKTCDASNRPTCDCTGSSARVSC